MKTLVELYDSKNIIDNILASYIFHPEQIVFLSDGRPKSMAGIGELRRALTARFPNMRFSHELLQNSRQVPEVCGRLMALYPDPVFDLTGGQDPVSFAVAQFCHQRFRPCICIDWREKDILCSEAAKEYRQEFFIPQLTIDDILQANGAVACRNMHQTPDKRRYDALLAFFEETLRRPKEWLSFCRYLQQMAAQAQREGHPLSIEGNGVITDRGGKIIQCHPDFARLAYQLGFFTQLELKKTKVSLTFSDETVLRYLTSQGTWLELYVFITAKKSGRFHDCQMSVVIDWDGVFQKRDNVVNEIDIVLMRGIRPVFISCKTSVPTTENLNEIELYAKKLGGSQAVAMLVTTTDVKKEAPIVFHRAQELDVLLVEREQLLEPKGLMRVLESIQG